MKSRIISILLSSIFWASLSSAQTDAVCDDLHSFSCAPGTYDDGTGKANSKGLPGEREMKDLILLRDFGSTRAVKLLAQPKSTLLRQYVMSFSGLDASEKCQGAEKSPSSECILLMAEAMSQLAVKDVLPNPMQTYGGPRVITLNARRLEALLNLPEMKSLRETISEEYLKRSGAEAFEKRIKSTLFPRAKELVLEKIKQFVPDPKARQAMLEKVGAMQFAGVNCSNGQGGGSSLSGLITHNAFAEPMQHQLHICAAYGDSSTSEFKLIQVIAHELAHTIDPCSIEESPKGFGFSYSDRTTIEKMDKEYPIPGLLNCLRSPGSIAAKNLNQPTGNAYQQYGGYGGVGSAPQGQPPQGEPQTPAVSADYCANMDPSNPYKGPSGDQATEAFCDWIATEVLTDYVGKYQSKLSPKQIRTGYSNIWRSSCSFQDSMNGSSFNFVHPSIEKRVNNLILVHPKVREQMKCPPLKASQGTYCAPVLVHSENSGNPRARGRSKKEGTN